MNIKYTGGQFVEFHSWYSMRLGVCIAFIGSIMDFPVYKKTDAYISFSPYSYLLFKSGRMINVPRDGSIAQIYMLLCGSLFP